MECGEGEKKKTGGGRKEEDSFKTGLKGQGKANVKNVKHASRKRGFEKSGPSSPARCEGQGDVKREKEKPMKRSVERAKRKGVEGGLAIGGRSERVGWDR